MKRFLVALITSLLFACSSGRGTSEVPSPAPAPSEARPSSPGTTLATTTPTTSAEGVHPESSAVLVPVSSTTLLMDTSTISAAVDTEPPRSLEQLSTVEVGVDRLAWTVHQTLVSNCMAERGFALAPEPYPEGGNIAIATQLYPTDDQVQSYGYAWRQYAVTVPPPLYSSIVDQSLLDALIGDGTNGCDAVAFRQLARSELSALEDVFAQAGSELRAAVLASEQVSTMTSQWSTCMNTNGYDVKEMREALRLAGTFGDPRSDGAVKLATADVSCQRGVRYQETLRSLNNAAVSKWLEAHPQDLDELHRVQAGFAEHIKSLADQLGVS